MTLCGIRQHEKKKKKYMLRVMLNWILTSITLFVHMFEVKPKTLETHVP